MIPPFRGTTQKVINPLSHFSLGLAPEALRGQAGMLPRTVSLRVCFLISIPWTELLCLCLYDCVPKQGIRFDVAVYR